MTSWVKRGGKILPSTVQQRKQHAAARPLMWHSRNNLVAFGRGHSTWTKWYWPACTYTRLPHDINVTILIPSAYSAAWWHLVFSRRLQPNSPTVKVLARPPAILHGQSFYPKEERPSSAHNQYSLRHCTVVRVGLAYNV